MEYTVYVTPGGEAGTVQRDQALPDGGSPVGSTANAAEAHDMVVAAVLGLRGHPGGLPCCEHCGLPQVPDGRGGWEHADAALGAVCAIVHGTGGAL